MYVVYIYIFVYLYTYMYDYIFMYIFRAHKASNTAIGLFLMKSSKQYQSIWYVYIYTHICIRMHRYLYEYSYMYHKHIVTYVCTYTDIYIFIMSLSHLNNLSNVIINKASTGADNTDFLTVFFEYWRQIFFNFHTSV